MLTGVTGVARHGLGRQTFAVPGEPPNEGSPRHKGELGSAELLSLTGSSNDIEGSPGAHRKPKARMKWQGIACLPKGKAHLAASEQM